MKLLDNTKLLRQLATAEQRSKKKRQHDDLSRMTFKAKTVQLLGMAVGIHEKEALPLKGSNKGMRNLVRLCSQRLRKHLRIAPDLNMELKKQYAQLLQATQREAKAINKLMFTAASASGNRQASKSKSGQSDDSGSSDAVSDDDGASIASKAAEPPASKGEASSTAIVDVSAAKAVWYGCVSLLFRILFK